MKKYKLTELLSGATIDAKLQTYAAEINAQYYQKPLTIIVIMRGAFYFAADLTRYLSKSMQLQILFLPFRTYRGKTKHSLLFQTEQLEKQFRQLQEVFRTPQHCLVLEDILDTGATIAALYQYLKQLNLLSLNFTVLLQNMTNQKQQQALLDPAIKVKTLFPWKSTPQVNWLMGYGLDLNDEGRHLRSVFEINDA